MVVIVVISECNFNFHDGISSNTTISNFMEIRWFGTDLLMGQIEDQTEGQRNMMNLQSNLSHFSRGLCCAAYFWVYLFSKTDWSDIWEIFTSCNI